MHRIIYCFPLIAGVIVGLGIFAPHFVHRLQKTQPPTVLLYNHIVPQVTQSQSFQERYPNVVAKNFADQLKYLRAHHIVILSLNEYNAAVQNKTPLHEPGVLLLFRDGYSDIATNALPLLQRYHAPAVVFMSPKNKGKEGYLTDDQIKQLDTNGVHVSPPNPVLLFMPLLRNEVSGVIQLPQFADLLPQTTYNSTGAALFIGLLTVLIFSLALFMPEYALLLPILLLPTYLVRFTIFGVPATFLELTLVTVLAGIVISRFREIKQKIVSFPYWPQTILFLFAAIISTWYAKDRMAALGGLKAYVIEPVCFGIVLFALTQKSKQYHRVLIALCVSCFAIACMTLAGYFSGSVYVTQNLEKLTTFFGNPNYLATFLGIGILISAYYSLVTKQTTARFLVGLALIIMVPSFLLAKSDTANVGVACGIAFLILWRLKSRLPLQRWIIGGLIVATLLGSLAAFTAVENPHDQAFLKSHKLGTLTSRFYIYQTTVNIIGRHAIAGVGLNNFNQAYLATVSDQATEQNVALAHNTMLDFWSQMGLIGLVAYLWLVIRFFRLLLTHQDHPITPILLAIMLAMLIHGMLDSQYHKNDYSVIFWLLIGLSAIVTLPRPDHK